MLYALAGLLIRCVQCTFSTHRPSTVSFPRQKTLHLGTRLHKRIMLLISHSVHKFHWTWMFHNETTKNHVCHSLCVESHDDVVILNVIRAQFSPIRHIMKIPSFLYGYINLYLVNVYWLLFARIVIETDRPRLRFWPWSVRTQIWCWDLHHSNGIFYQKSFES